jgi:hypothetical protein
MPNITIDGLYHVVCPLDGVPVDMRVAGHQVVSCSHASELPECPGNCRAKEHLLNPDCGHRLTVECPEQGQSAEVFVRRGRVEVCSLDPVYCDQACLKKK